MYNYKDPARGKGIKPAGFGDDVIGDGSTKPVRRSGDRTNERAAAKTGSGGGWYDEAASE